MKKAERAAAEAQIRLRYSKMESGLTERARRLFVASEAMAFGHGGIAAASRATGHGSQCDWGRHQRSARYRGWVGRSVATDAESSARWRAQEDDGEGPIAGPRFEEIDRVYDARRSGVTATVDGAQSTQHRGSAQEARAPDKQENGVTIAQGSRLQSAGKPQAAGGRAASGSECSVRAYQ